MHGTIDSLFRVEWRPLADLDAIATEWRDLADRALEPNVFYEPSFALAAAPVFGRDAGAGLVWSRAALASEASGQRGNSKVPPRLVGFFPARIERRRYGIALPVLVGWTHPYAPLGTPLVDRETGEDAIAAWLDHVAADPKLPDVMLLPYLPMDGALARAFDGVLAHRGGRSACFAPHRRALLRPSGDRTSYLDDSVGHKKRKELRRQRKRLDECGRVTSSSTGEPAAMPSALAEFLALEAGGWKGRAGTAARGDAEIAKFITSAVTALAGEGKARIARLHVGTHPTAAIVTLRSGATAWCWKIAYDESYGRYSPGVQILLDVTQALLDDPSVVCADSCATADHPMIDHVWRERLALADRLMSVGSARSFGFALARTLETLRHAAIGGAKALRDLAKRR